MTALGKTVAQACRAPLRCLSPCNAGVAEAAQDAYAAYAFAARRYGKIRWQAAGLIFANEAIALGDEVEDSTLQVALDRAFEAYRVAAAADTVAAFDFAHEATETAAQLTAAAYSDGDEPDEGGEAPESAAAPLDASQAWFKATEAVHDAVKAAEDADAAKDATSAAIPSARAAADDAKMPPGPYTSPLKATTTGRP